MEIKLLIRNISLFLFFGLIQVLFINNMELGSWDITPYIYISAILLAPFETPRWVQIVEAFLLGLLVDIFADTGGMHAFATVFIAFVRIVILNILSPRDGYEAFFAPSEKILGIKWFFKYTLIMSGIHSLIFFLLDAFSLSYFIAKIHIFLLSYISSVALIILGQFLIFRD